MYLYQQTNRYFAQSADDLKEIAEQELRSLGASDTKQAYRGIYFTANRKALYAINYHSRLISRVLAPLAVFDCHSDKYLYRRTSEIPWSDFLDPAGSFAVFASVSGSAIRHSKFAALRLKDAVADHFKARYGQRPTVDTMDPDLWINLHIERNKATIGIDTSGGSLHRRGYRKSSVEAPMVETLAAAIIEYAGWNGETPFYDPFCGSGTLLCEAYMRASRMPAAFLRRRFGFERLPDFEAPVWDQVKKEGIRAIRPVLVGLISGSDLSPEAVAASTQNCAVIDRAHAIRIERRDIFDVRQLEGVTIVCNPPYGIRMARDSDVGDFYRRLGDFFKQRCLGATAYLYFGDRGHIKHLGLKPSWKKPLSNGGLDGRLVKIELF